MHTGDPYAIFTRRKILPLLVSVCKRMENQLALLIGSIKEKSCNFQVRLKCSNGSKELIDKT